MKLVDDFARRYADGRDEETRFLLNDNVDELRQLATCIIKLSKHVNPEYRRVKWKPHTFVLRALPPIWGSSKSTPNGALGSFRSFFSDFIYAFKVGQPGYGIDKRPVSASESNKRK